MNKQRRTAIAKFREQFDKIKSDLVSQLEAVRDEIDTIKSDEEDAYNNMPRSLQDSERGEQSQAASEKLQEIYDAFDELVTKSDEIESLFSETEEF